MARHVRLAALAVPLLVAALLSPLSPVQPATPEAHAGEAPAWDTLLFHARGTSQRVSGSAPERFVFEVDLFDAGGQKVGALVYDVEFTSPLTMDLVSTFHLPGGDLVNHSVQAIAPDATPRPGFFLAGVHADKDTIVGQQSTGVFAGRTGRVWMSGWHDGSKFPQEATFNDFWVIQLNPAS